MSFEITEDTEQTAGGRLSSSERYIVRLAKICSYYFHRVHIFQQKNTCITLNGPLMKF